MNVVSGVRTDVGKVRKGNEDSYLVKAPLFGIADGMGGHVAGDVASSTAVEVLDREAGRASAEDPQSLVALIQDANSAIFDKASDDQSLQGMGTTCTLILIDGDQAYLAHVGDSRAYLLRDNKMSRLSEDHTLVGRMVKEGRLTEEEAAKHPQRSIITRVLGVEDTVEVDLRRFTLEDGDRVMLCSDGLTSMVDEQKIASVLHGTDSAQDAADQLVDLANDAGGEDNITVIVLDIGGENGERASAAPAAAASAPATSAPAKAETAQKPARPLPERPDDPPGMPAPPTAPAPPPDRPQAEEPDTGGRRWVRKLVVALLVTALLVGGGLWAIRYSLSNSWFVGLDDSGTVTIFQGRPEEVAGFSLREVEETTGIKIEDVPQFLHDDLEEGIKVDSLEDARARVQNIQDQIDDSEPARSTSGSKGG